MTIRLNKSRQKTVAPYHFVKKSIMPVLHRKSWQLKTQQQQTNMTTLPIEIWCKKPW
jgi:hypothetical protein